MPQMVKRTLPAVTNEVITLVKDTDYYLYSDKTNDAAVLGTADVSQILDYRLDLLLEFFSGLGTFKLNAGGKD